MIRSLLGVLALTVALPAFGAMPVNPQQAVIQAAQAYISRNAPDFGGTIDQPCPTQVQSDGIVVTCSGVAHETIGGGGSTPIDFMCVGHFVQGENASYYARGPIHCVR